MSGDRKVSSRWVLGGLIGFVGLVVVGVWTLVHLMDQADEEHARGYEMIRERGEDTNRLEDLGREKPKSDGADDVLRSK